MINEGKIAMNMVNNVNSVIKKEILILAYEILLQKNKLLFMLKQE